jgi:peptide/nickel transport system substrate-binding protein
VAAPAPVEAAQEESMKRTMVGLIVVLTLGLGLGLAREGTAAPRGTLTIGIPTDINTLDPQMSPEVNSLNVAFSTMEPLVRLDAQGNIKPLLAESWEVVDNVTYVFRLRKNVKFHNGEPFTGKAVEYSWKRSQEKHRANKTYFASVSRIEHLDDHTIRIVTEKPDPVFLKKMGAVSAAIFAPKATADGGDEATSLRPVGTGPFILSSWVKGEHITFKANPGYYLPDVPRVETLVWRVIPEAAARVAALQTGQVDIALRIPPHQVALLERDANLRVSSALSTRTYYIAFNNLTTGKGTPVADTRVRQAMNHGVDLQAIIRSVYNGQAQRVNSLIGNVQFGHDPTLPPMAYDPAKAKQLLAEAGVGSGFKVGMACPSGAYANDKEACQAIAGSLGKIGIEVDLQIMESNRFWDLQAKKQLPPLFFDGVGDRLQDPGVQLRGVAHPAANWTAFEKKEFTDLIDQGGSTVDQEQRKRVYAKLARDMQADPPFLFLWQVKNFEGVRKRVQGYTTRPTEDMGHVAFDVGVE